MFFYLHLLGETPVSIDGVYYEEIPTESVHLGERANSRDLDGSDKRKSEVEDRV